MVTLIRCRSVAVDLCHHLISSTTPNVAYPGLIAPASVVAFGDGNLIGAAKCAPGGYPESVQCDV